MKQVDTLLTHGITVTMDASYQIFPDGAVAIKNDSIVAVGPATDITSEYKAKEVIDCTGLIVIPGLINAHTHIPMTLLRGLADDLRLDVWLNGYMMPTEREFVDAEFVRIGTLLACAEMIAGGTTTFNDMYYFEEAVAGAAAEVGMRGVCGQTIMKYPAPDADSYEDALARARKFIQEWKDHPLIVPSVAPHAPYTCTDGILKACGELAIEFDVPLHIHISETAQEVQDSRNEFGMPVVPRIKKLGLLDAKVIAAHCVHIDEGEMRTLEHYGAGISHNPSSNLKLASGIAKVNRMLELNLNVGIGTDGPASNNDLDMFEEARLAAFIAKVATPDGDPTALPAKKAFAMATSEGAKALHLDHITGSLEPGKRADIAIIESRRLHNWPEFHRDPDNVYSRLIYATKSNDVRDVMCNGRWLMRDRELLTVEPEKLYDLAGDYARQIDEFLIAREGDVLSKLLALGELQQEESFEVQVKGRIPNPEEIDRLLAFEDISIIKHTHYKQHDTYFEFGGPDLYRLRYREDDFIDTSGDIANVRTRLTMTSDSNEREFDNAIVLSHSRYIASATRPLRFYREYFQAETERTVVKERLRWHILYKDLRLYVNLDKLTEPEFEGYFFEIKSRTWSKVDAELKANIIDELLDRMNRAEIDLTPEGYVEFGAIAE